MNLLRGKRSFHFGLIVPDQIEAIPGNSADAVQNKDSLHTAIQNYIAAMKFGRNTVFNDSFVPARKKKRIHTVALRFQFDGRTVFLKLFNIVSVHKKLHLADTPNRRNAWHFDEWL